MTQILSTPAEGIFRFPQWPPGESGTQGIVSVNQQHGYPEVKIALPKVEGFVYPPKDERVARPEILVGQLLNKQEVTLINNSLVDFEFSTGKFGLGGQQPAITYDSGILLVGKRSFDDKDAVEFDEITMELHNLGAWMWRNIISHDSSRSHGKAGYDHVIRYSDENSIFSCMLNDSDEFEIGDRLLSMNYPWVGGDVCESIVKACHFVRYRNANIMQMDETIKHIKAILNFFSLGLGSSTHCLRVWLSNPEMRQDGVEVEFYVQDMFRETGQYNRPHPDFMLFPFSKIESQLPDIAGRWIKLYRKIPDILDYYFAMEGNKNRYVEHRFLGLARTLETLYAHVVGIRKDPACEKTKQDVIASCPDDFKRWLTKNLASACFPSFSDKIRYFIGDFSNMTGCSVPNADKIVKRIAILRNEATHRGVLKNRDDYNVMVHVSDLMTLLVQYALAREIGVSQDVCKQHIAENKWILLNLQDI